ncbi:MAG: beta-propeller domain-containing protein, partial [Pyrinomonadaceae bacterium]
MKTLISFAVATAFVISITAGCADNHGTDAPLASASAQKAPPKKTMRAFRSEQELASFFRRVAEERKREQERSRGERREAATAAPQASAQANLSADSKAKDDEAESVTNVQHAGVDEGGIVKLHGNHLVVLRRGRLFTVAVGDGELRPISALDAFGPEIDPRHAWYDEMLISGDTIAVIGYSYERGGTEIGLFRIDDDGNLRYRSTYHLRSNDYYSSRNYASRLIGDKLVFYTPLYLQPEAVDPFQSFPALRKWRKGAKNDEFRRVAAATRVYRPEQPVSADYGMALHTVTVCDLARDDMACEATAVVGAPGRVFYVSPESVYVWTTDWARDGNQARARSTLYRMPLDGSGPSALQVSGSPVDQFSFLESADGNLNVLVRSWAAGDGMWNAEVTAGDVALLRVPVAAFSDGQEDAPQWT